MRHWILRRALPALAAFGLLLPLTAALVACQDPTGYELYGDYPCLSADPWMGSEAKREAGGFWSINDEFAMLAREVPGGFGGLFYNTHPDSDRMGRLTIYLTDPSKKEAAFAALAEFGWHPQVVLKGAYDWLQLGACYETLHGDSITPGLWSFEGLTMTDMDERYNRLHLGIEDLADEPALRDMIAEIGLPQGMVMVEEVHPDIATIGDPDRPDDPPRD